MTQRVVRLLVLLGVGVAAYLLLSLFDHAARADTGSVDHVGAAGPVDSVKAVAVGATSSNPEPKSIIRKSTAPKAHPQTSHRPTIQVSEVHAPKVKAPKRIHAPKVRAQRVTSKLRQPTYDAVWHAARATVTPARTVVVRQKLSTPAQLPPLPELTELSPLSQVVLPTLPQLPGLSQAQFPALPQLPGLSQAQFPALPQLPGLSQAQFPALSQLPSWSHLPDPPQARTPKLGRTTVLPSAPVPHQALMPPAFAPASGLFGVTEPPAAQAQPRTAPLPAPARQPADRSTPTGQARDSGGSSVPAMGTVSSSWRPEVAAAGRRLATDLIARGRTVRYAGPPS